MILLVVGIALEAPFAKIALVQILAFAPMTNAVAVFALALTAWMFVAQSRVNASAPLAILGCAFATLAATYAINLLQFPAESDPIRGLRSVSGTTPVVRACGRFAFDVLVVLYAASDHRERRQPGSTSSWVAPAWIAAALAMIAIVVAGTVFARDMPLLIDRSERFTSLYTYVVLPVLLLATASAAACILLLGRRTSRIRIWMLVVLTAMSGNVLGLSLGAGLFTIGFYFSRIYDLIATITFVFVAQAQLGAILRRAQRSDERARELSEVIALGDAQSFNGINDMLSRVASEFGFDSACLCRLGGNEIVVEFAFGEPGYPRGYRTPIGASILGRAIEARALLVIDDFEAEEWSAERACSGDMWGSCCALPLIVEDGIYGALVFANAKGRPKSPTSLELDFLRLVAVLVGNALDRIRQKKRLDELAYFDALTGLPNRVLLLDRITSAVVAAGRYGRRVALHFMDLDDFKPINDRFGHAAGDDVLREVARRLESTVRASDTVGRYGGDEFVILQPVVDGAEGIDELAARVAAAFREPLVVAAGSFYLTVSSGVSVYPSDGKDAHTLLLRADEAQYRAKDARKAARANGPLEI